MVQQEFPNSRVENPELIRLYRGLHDMEMAQEHSGAAREPC
jgi:hypothetical protein